MREGGREGGRGGEGRGGEGRGGEGRGGEGRGGEGRGGEEGNCISTLAVPSHQDVQDQMEDKLEQTGEIMEALGRPYGLPDDVDEDDLEAGN